jgi:hypothetical protein
VRHPFFKGTERIYDRDVVQPSHEVHGPRSDDPGPFPFERSCRQKGGPMPGVKARAEEY